MKGCGFFRILDMKAEGRGPCVGGLGQGRVDMDEGRVGLDDEEG